LYREAVGYEDERRWWRRQRRDGQEFEAEVRDVVTRRFVCRLVLCSQLSCSDRFYFSPPPPSSSMDDVLNFEPHLVFIRYRPPATRRGCPPCDGRPRIRSSLPRRRTMVP
jgi:hypothetical protein